MATIGGATNERIFSITKWLGLNQNPDGDTKLRMGEAAAMTNWAITRDGNLKQRRGSHAVAELSAGKPVKGLWTGWVNQHEYMLAACDGKLYKVWDDTDRTFGATELGSIDTTNDVFFIGFENKVYMLNGVEYKVWDGTTLADVSASAYRPLVTITVPPAGGGETLEQVNKLTGGRRCWISPDGTGATFQLPEKGLQSLDWVKNLSTDATLVSGTDYTADLAAGTVTFSAAPPEGVNSYEIAWTMETNFSSSVKAMRFAEIYNGGQDTRMFLYGDGTNEAFYTGIDYDGNPRADYIPDMNEIRVGDENTPITAMIRHFSALIAFKVDSAYSVGYGLTTLANGQSTPSFYVSGINKSIGNAAPGQVQLVLNNPYTIFGNDIYEWKNASYYSSALSRSETQAKRISDRVYAAIRDFDLENCHCYDDNDNQEWYCCNRNGKAIVHNYAVDAWYCYDDFDALHMANLRGEIYFGNSRGAVEHFSYDYYADDGEAINAYWESGSMSFGSDYMRKYAAQLWLGIKPESHGEVWVTVQTDRKSTYTEKAVASELFSFRSVNFGRWAFRVNRKPQMTRLKIKAKKFVFYKLILKSTDAATGATVLAADIRVRFTGYAK